MTHDPLCMETSDYESFRAEDGHLSLGRKCYCDLIAKVRADEKSRLIRSVVVYDPSGILIRPEADAWVALQDLEKA